jgi:hypothetical protein
MKSYLYHILGPFFEHRNKALDKKMHVEGDEVANFDKMIRQNKPYKIQIICETPI